MRSENKKEIKKNNNAICHLVGGIALCTMAIVAIPKTMTYLSGAIYKNLVKISNAKKNEYWGPVVEKKK